MFHIVKHKVRKQRAQKIRLKTLCATKKVRTGVSNYLILNEMTRNIYLARHKNHEKMVITSFAGHTKKVGELFASQKQEQVIYDRGLKRSPRRENCTLILKDLVGHDLNWRNKY
jgi:hypothetical protein